MVKITAIIVLLLQISPCFGQSDGTFLIYNAHKNRCLGDDLQRLDVCNPQNVRQQFRWTSENRIFNAAQKKCLGAGSKSEGNKLQWFICDPNSDLQKWECQSDSQFGLKNESLYLSIQGDSYLLTLSTDPGDKGKWTIHGTMDSVCSRPYQEIYTIKGNAFGQPCQFPFRFNNKWYADCTTEGSSTKQLWCATESDYEPKKLWGYCPTRQRDRFWTKSPLSDVYYQVNEQSALSWDQARKSCQQQDGDLMSVTEPHQQAFISGLTQTFTSSLWMGLNSLDMSRGWHWINGQPVRYLKWLSGEPSSLPGRSCGMVSQQYASEWSTAVCSERHGYICQSSLSTPTLPPVVHTGFCPSPWIPYSGHCYYLNRIKRTWLEARDACRKEGGDLLSILSVEEQSFVISQLGYSKTDELWTGFNDLKTSMLFEWSDHSSVPFALWDVNEPSHTATLNEDCVSMRGEEGKWADQNCQNKYGYICKKNTHSAPSTNDTVVSSLGCKPGWIRHGYHCYLPGSETKTFEEAKQMCENTGSYLVDIASSVENAFLVSLIGTRPEKHFWIGLSNQKNRHSFEWTNTERVSFTHFNAGMPGRKQGCVAMTTGVLAGLWDVLSCTNAEKYICKQKAEGVITTPAPPTTPALSCSDGWKPIRNRNLCYKLFSVNQPQKKTWSEALDYCRELGGDLLSIHSSEDIEQPDHPAYEYSKPAWIGYSIQDPSVGYTWSDGSSSSFQNWEEGEPNNANNLEKCATWRSRWWHHRGWNDVHCQERHSWFCEIEKGVTPKEVEMKEFQYNKTDDGWIIFKDSQYYIGRHYGSAEDARSYCKKRHGDLAVINDEEERLFLWLQIKQEYGSNAYIGITIDMDKSFRWMDGSPTVFQAWEENQPAFLNSEQHCVQMTLSQGLWESVNCGDPGSFICKRSGDAPVNTTVAPTEPPTGGCDHDWVKFQQKCYKVQLEQKTWSDARTYCKRLGGNLASVSNGPAHAFLTIRMADDDNTPDLWLGLSNLAGRSFKWTDGSRVTFTKWPERDFMHYMSSRCVAMGSKHRSQLGVWVKKDCNDTNGFICSRALDRSINPVSTEVPKTFQKVGNSSYMLVQTNFTWKEAQRHCESQGSNLVSIRDFLTQSYIELQTHTLGKPLWIGLNSMETHGYFLWIDNWMLNMEKWSYNEPRTGRPCVYADVDGGWKTSDCNQTYYSMCKKSTEVAPTPPTQYPGVCPDDMSEGYRMRMTWQPFRGHCYSFVTRENSWTAASNFCKLRGASLASIEDTKEAEFVEHFVSYLGNGRSNFWIGLFKTYAGNWLWMDNNVVDYTNWEESEAEDYNNNNNDYDDYFPHFGFRWFYHSKNCAFISSETKKWKKHSCERYEAYFICKTAKVIEPTEGMNNTVVTDEPHRTYVAGVSVVVVMVVLCVLGGLAYIYRKTSKHQVAVSTFQNPMYYTTVSSLPEEKDTKTLVDHTDINE